MKFEVAAIFHHEKIKYKNDKTYGSGEHRLRMKKALSFTLILIAIANLVNIPGALSLVPSYDSKGHSGRNCNVSLYYD